MNFRPRKRFAQNFLLDPIVVQDIISVVNPGADQHIVEIGPGFGSLTEGLSRCRFLDIIEIDRQLVEELRKIHGNANNVRVHRADALHFDFNNLIRPPEKLRIVGNLPYNISTPLLFRLLHFSEKISDMHFMLQKEVADRACAVPGTKRYGKLSVMMQYRCRIEQLFDVSPKSFKPVPKVMSSMVKIEPLLVPPVVVQSAEVFASVVAKAFGQRRKTLRNALKHLISEAQIGSLGIDPGVRAEMLDLEAFAQLSNLLKLRPHS